MRTYMRGRRICGFYTRHRSRGPGCTCWKQHLFLMLSGAAGGTLKGDRSSLSVVARVPVRGRDLNKKNRCNELCTLLRFLFLYPDVFVASHHKFSPALPVFLPPPPQIRAAVMDEQCSSHSQAEGRPGVVRCGWLRKQGGFVKTWHSRWFVLRGDQLHYYKDEEETKPLVRRHAIEPFTPSPWNTNS